MFAKEGHAVSKLRSVIETLRTESLSGLPDARVLETFSELNEAMRAIEAERLRRLADGGCSSATVTGRIGTTWHHRRRADAGSGVEAC